MMLTARGGGTALPSICQGGKMTSDDSNGRMEWLINSICSLPAGLLPACLPAISLHDFLHYVKTCVAAFMHACVLMRAHAS